MKKSKSILDQKHLTNFIKKQPKWPIYKQRSSSLLVSNPLTKSYFSLRDTSLNNRVDLKSHLKEAVQKITKPSKHLHRYTESQQEMKPSVSFRDITHSQIPRIKLKPQPKTQSEKRSRSDVKDKTQSMKFKLLFRDKPERKTASERKIDRLSRKIHNLETHRKSIQKYIPVKEPQVIIPKQKPKGTIVGPGKIEKLIHTLIHNIELYFNMYETSNKVGDMLKSVEGFNSQIKRLLIHEDGCKARRIKTPDQLTPYFWVFKPPYQRPQFYGEEDLNLYNALQNFILKMEKTFTDVERNYISFQTKKLQQTQKSIAKQLTIYQKKYEPHPEITNINKFLQNRVRHNQERREENLSRLESLGVRFNVQERSRELVIRGRERVMNNYNLKKYMI